uniref:Poly [ADP-ribose] polymerase n=1 Tax=Sinocyclocheilus grahami TaxID=75366 RepID=A0A672QQY9_SINGR
MADSQDDKLYKAEYAKSGRASCKKCKENIAKDSLRMVHIPLSFSPMFDGKVPHWHHFSCFWLRAAVQSPSDISGFIDLRWGDQEKVKKAIESGDATGGEQKGAAKGEKILNDFAVEYAKSNRSTCKGCDQKIEKDHIRVSKKTVDPEKPQLGLIDRWYHTGCFVSRREELLFKPEYSAAQLKGFAALRDEDKEELKKRLPAVKNEGNSSSFCCSCQSFSAQLSNSTSRSVMTVNKPLTGLKLLAVGKLSKNKDELKNAVEELGGKITGSANKAALCLSNKKEIEKTSKKMEEVRDAGVRVVAEGFLTDIKESGKALQELISLHAISPWGAEVKVESQAAAPASKSTGAHSSKSTGRVKEEEGGSKSKKMKLTVKGGAAVDPESGLENCAHVLDQNGKSYSATLGLVDIVRGTNSYYKLQLLEDDVKKQYWVFRSWGRVGTTIGGNKLDKFYDKNSAMDNFCSVYEEKTGNAWASSNFTKYPNKFYPLEIDYGQDEEAVKKLTASAGTKSKLDKPIQDLIRLIFDVESMKKAMVEFEIDLQKMPLGKLSKRQIQSAYSLLSEVQQVGSEKALILDLSNRFYTLIPHDFGMKKPPLLNNMDYIQQKVQMLDNLLDIEVAYSLLRGGVEDNKKDPIDINYEKLKTKIEVVDKSSSEAQLIQQYVKNTHAATHNTYTLDVEEIFKIDREGEYQCFHPFKELHNRQLLWHGSRTTNYAGILSQGLRIAPPEAPVTGYMFGKGVYFADMVSKSANYCHTSQADPVGLILLGEVALGNMHELKKASHITKLPKGKHSVKGLGRTAPDPRAAVSLNGVDVPLGKGINTNIEDTSLLYNEYIVYDIAQVNLKYLLKIRFNYQTSLW